LLVVDDDEMVRRSMVRFLAHAGFEVVSVSSGAAALTLLEHGEQFDAAVVDLEMPDMDGLDLIRALAKARPELPVGLYSGSTRMDELTPEQLGHASFAKHKAQPIGELVQAICKAVYGARETQASSGTSGEPEPRNGNGRGSNGSGDPSGHARGAVAELALSA
jgi:CheY-like chemotaxis protein